MDSKELRVALDKLNVPSTYYSINGDTSPNKYIFRHVHTYWECFYIDERGNENDYHKFFDENDACVHFLKILKTEMSY